jgi:hypothetical protein
MKYLAWFFSILFHPLIILNFGFALILFLHPYYSSKFYDEQLRTFIIYMVVNSLIMPLLVLLLLKRFKFLDSFIISDHKQRTYPYLIITVLLGITAFQLFKNEMGGLPLYFLIGSTICLFLNAILTLKFGISSHTIAAGGLLGLVIYIVALQHIAQLDVWMIASILIAGLSGTSRLILRAHTHAQIYWGYLLGFGVVLTTLIIFDSGIFSF